VKLFQKNSNLCDHNPPTSQTDGQTDRQTTCDRNTALCTKVHRAVKRLSRREGGERCNRPILAKYIGGSRNCIWGTSRASVERRGKMAHFGGILAVNVKFYSMNMQNSKNTPKSSGYKRIRCDKERQTVR